MIQETTRLANLVEYNQAMQNPWFVFADEGLKRCSVEKDPLGLPLGSHGGFAVTYHMYDSRSDWAVRCFYKSPGTHMQERYDAISRFLEKNANGVFIRATLRNDGILAGGRWCPIVKMPWLRGEELNVYIERNLSSPKEIAWLSEAFVNLVKVLEKLAVAHGDLQHGNIMVTEASLRLVDYDGMYLPELANLSGAGDGHANYQPLSRSEAKFGPHIDRFSEIVIYTALEALATAPDLWHKYSDGDNLLFKRADFENPEGSPLLHDLESLGRIGPLAKRFRSVCYLEFEHVPTLEDFMVGKIPTPTTRHVPKPVSPTPSIPTFNADDILNLSLMVGQRVQVQGQVAWVKRGLDRNGHLYIHIFFEHSLHPRISQRFMLVIWPSTLRSFPNLESQATQASGSWVNVIGMLTTYGGTPQIVIMQPSQLRLMPTPIPIQPRIEKPILSTHQPSSSGHTYTTHGHSTSSQPQRSDSLNWFANALIVIGLMVFLASVVIQAMPLLLFALFVSVVALIAVVSSNKARGKRKSSP